MIPHFMLQRWGTIKERRPLRGGYQPWVDGGPDGRLGWIRADREGDLYAATRGQPKGARVGNPLLGVYGSILKFDPAKRWTQEIMLPPGKPTEGRAGRENGVTWSSGVFVPDVERIYAGRAFMGHGCTCRSATGFELDEYGRLYIPDPPAGKLRVLDNAGNEVMALSGTVPGEASDERGSKAIHLGFPHQVAATRAAIYVWDPLNERVVRVGLTHAAEATCEVEKATP
jgi:hypothetical protein